MSDKADDRVAKALSLPPGIIRTKRLAWNGEQVMRAILADRIQHQIDERTRGLETIAPDHLEKQQGEIVGLRLALSQLTRKEQ